MSDRTPVKRREWIADLLDRLEVVRWDRFTVGEARETGEQEVSVYGWVPRDDDHEDFVVVTFWPESGLLRCLTSSDEHSERFQALLFGEGAVEDHNPCRRVENAFDVENAVELGQQTTLGEVGQ